MQHPLHAYVPAERRGIHGERREANAQQFNEQNLHVTWGMMGSYVLGRIASVSPNRAQVYCIQGNTTHRNSSSLHGWARDRRTLCYSANNNQHSELLLLTGTNEVTRNDHPSFDG